MTVEFEPKNKPIILKVSGNITEKVTFVQNLYEKAHDKINHFDRLRQQFLNYALLVFSGLLAFIMKTDNPPMQVVGCVGIVVLMVIFRYLDHRYHTSTHGFASSMTIFSQVIAHLLENSNDDVSFLQYHTPGEKTVQRWSLQTRIYFILALSGGVLGVTIALMAIVRC